ncbi:MAG TPA: SDR family oxidoreductase [Nitrospirae bacterium]|nr:SDR family oxidoreductase [Nitrospirota bacterium]
MGYDKIFDLTGQTAVVTGALGKLGPIWLEALLSFGANVFAMDHPDAKSSKRFNSLKDEYGAKRVHLAYADIMNRAALVKALDKCVDNFGIPHILVNNAGIDLPPEPGASYALEDIPEEKFMPALLVNVSGLFQVTQVFGGAMIKQGRGSIINIGSLYASVSPNKALYDHIDCEPPFIKPPAYGASKAAVLNLTRYFATHWGSKGVRVNALSPGGVLGGQDEEFKRKFSERTPLGRLAVAEDLAGPLVFLASSASSYVTGVNLPVEGGYTAW